MSQQAALRFVREVREDATLRSRVEALGDHATLDDVAALASDAGFPCTADELRAAHGHDWGMRWVRHGASRDRD